MSFVNASTDFLKNFDPLNKPTQKVKNWLENNPKMFKVALIINHLFRAVMMVGFMIALPFSAPVNVLIGLAGTLFYRLTIQGHCPYKLDLTSVFGAFSLLVANNGLKAIIAGIAFKTLAASALTVSAFVPLAFYAFYVIITSEKKCCCKESEISSC